MKKLLAVEINGQCQLHCPHCYIDKKEWPKTLMSNEVVDNLSVENYEQVAVVATEPFFNQASLAATLRLGRRAREAGKTFSVISNALALAHAFEIAPELKDLLSWIDISMDVPGTEGYAGYRGGSWRKFLKGVESAHVHGVEVSILNTVSTRTLPFFEDMISTSEALSDHFFTVSPMISATSRCTEYGTEALDSVQKFLELSASSDAFQVSVKARLDIGLTICQQTGEDINELRDLAVRLGIQNKVEFFDLNPDDLIDRVTVAGNTILPSQTIVAAQQ